MTDEDGSSPLPRDAVGFAPLRQRTALLYKRAADGPEQLRRRGRHRITFTKSICNHDCISTSDQPFMPENPAIAFIDALKAKLRCASDEQLSQKLGLGKSTLASWRLRASVPKRVRDDMLIEHGIDYDKLALNDDGIGKIIRDQIQTAFFISILRLGKIVEEKDVVDVASWIANNDHLVRNFFMGDFEREFGMIYERPEEFTQMLLRVARGEQGSPEAILAFKRQWEERKA